MRCAEKSGKLKYIGIRHEGAASFAVSAYGKLTGKPATMPDRKIAPPADVLKQASSMLKSVKRPVIIVGHGARYNMQAVTTLAETLNGPVLTTFKAKGLIADHGKIADGRHPLGGGVLGRSGTPIAS